MEPQGLFPVALTAGRRQFMGQDQLRMSGRLSMDMFHPLFRQAQRADYMIIVITKFPLLQIPFPYQTCDNTAIVIVIAGIPHQQ